MNTKRLLLIFFALGGICLAFGSRSTLNPGNVGDHVFYGADVVHFLSQEIATGDFDGDFLDDIVSTIKWDDPTPGGSLRHQFTEVFACTTLPAIAKTPWGTVLATNGQDTLRICDFAGDFGDRHRAEWWALGWDSLGVGDCQECYDEILSDSTAFAVCDSCHTYELRAEDQGAAYVFLGGDWSGKGHDIDLANGGADHMILGRAPGGRIYNAMAAGDMDGDGRAELALGAPDLDGATGEVYVIRGSNAWPDTIDLADPDDFDNWVLHYFIGRDSLDSFGLGIALGDLDDDDLADLVVAAPGVDGESGAVYVFYAGESIPEFPTVVDLSSLSDNQIAGYGQVIYGAAEGDRLGVTSLPNLHPPHHGMDAHTGSYNPVGLAVGNWNTDAGDNVNDLVLGAGKAGSGAGKAYVIFGGGTSAKLAPGNTVDLANTPGPSTGACDIRIDGTGTIALGAGVALLDADGEGADDLLIGAPRASGDGKTERGEAFIIFSTSRDSLESLGSGVRDVTNAAHTDVVIYGEDDYFQLGGHFSGGSQVRSLDVDDDGMSDIGIAGQRNMTLIFGQSRQAWEEEIDLATAIDDQPEMRVLRFDPQEYARSTTIRIADLDGDDHHDLVFGGYDSPGYPGGDNGALHAGQMWVTKGRDFFKRGTMAESETWAGVVFVDGDLFVPEGETLTISAGTDVWVWPIDLGSEHLADTTSAEIHVYGKLDVQGTFYNPVRFRAWGVDESTNNPDAKWYGLFVWEGDSTSTISNCVIENASRAIQVRGNAVINTVSISNCRLRGVSVAGDEANVDLANITVTGSEIGFRFADDAVASMTNCSASDAIYGVRVASGASVSVTGGTMSSSDIGAYLSTDGSSTEAVFDGTIFANACSVGVHVEGNVSGGIGDCSIVALTDGIFLDHTGIGFTVTGSTIGATTANGITCDGCEVSVVDNTISNSGVGIWCDDEAAPVIRSNSIKLNTIGVSALNDADPDVGWGCSASCDTTGGCTTEGGNSFKTNSSHHIVNLSAGLTIMAECNFYKNGPKASQFSGSVDYLPARSTDPLPVAERVGAAVPERYALGRNYPNPFNPSTTVKYQVPAPGGDVSIRVYDVSGRLVYTLVAARQQAGYYETQWTGINDRGAPVASGIYFLRMTAPRFVETRKLVLLK